MMSREQNLKLKEYTEFLTRPLTDFFVLKKTGDYDYDKNKK